MESPNSWSEGATVHSKSFDASAHGGVPEANNWITWPTKRLIASGSWMTSGGG